MECKGERASRIGGLHLAATQLCHLQSKPVRRDPPPPSQLLLISAEQREWFTLSRRELPSSPTLQSAAEGITM